MLLADISFVSVLELLTSLLLVSLFVGWCCCVLVESWRCLAFASLCFCRWGCSMRPEGRVSLWSEAVRHFCRGVEGETASRSFLWDFWRELWIIEGCTASGLAGLS